MTIDRPATTEEIVITDEMIEAGAKAIIKLGLLTNDADLAALAAHRAMLAVKHNKRKEDV
jgi:predicted nucleic acid-binding protein